MNLGRMRTATAEGATSGARARRPLKVALILGGAFIASVFAAAIALGVVNDNGTYSVEVADNTTSASITTTAGAKVTYIGNADVSLGSAGTGVFKSFVRVQANPTEQGYNTDGTLQFDTSAGTWTHSMLVSDIPVVTIGGVNYWELFSDINESNSTPHISLTDLQVYFTSDHNLTGYPFSGTATEQYAFGGDIKINDVNAGSGQADLRYDVPLSGITIPANCGYLNPACNTFFVLYSKWGVAGTYASDGGFEEWKVKQYPTLQVVKNTIGGDATFGFTVGGPTPLTPSITTVNGTGSSLNSVIDPGTYTVSENSPPSGWDFKNATCSFNGGTPTAYTPGSNLVIGDTDHVVCTFTNSLRGHLTLVKNTVGGDGTFAFTNTGVTGLATSLTTSGGTNSSTSSAIVPASTYAVGETVPAGWDLTSAVCKLADGTTVTGTLATSNITGITVEAGKTTTCTFTNTARGHLTLVKNTVGGDGTFAFTNTGVTGLATSLTTSGGTNSSTSSAIVPASTYAVGETVPAGWDLTSAVCKLADGTTVTGTLATSNITGITVEAGKTTTCTFTNTARGHLTLVKNTVGGDGTFAFTNTGVTGLATSLTTSGGTNSSTSSAIVPASTYAVGETVPAGWDLTSAVCKLADGTTVTGTLATSNITGITVEAGKTTTCTFTNTKGGLLKLVKNTVGGDGTFAFTNNAAGLATSLTTSGGTANDTSDPLTPGSGFSISETVPAGWDLTGLSCVLSDGTTATGTVASPGITGITVEAGKTTTCTFTNTARGHLKLVKNTVGGDGTFAFTNNAAGLDTSLTTSGGTANDTSDAIVPGSGYSISETVPAGWDLTSLSCVLSDGTTATGTVSSPGITGITVEAGKTTTCTFANTARGHLKLVKNTVGGDGTFAFTNNAAGLDTSLTTSGGTANDTSDAIVPGNGYSIAETVPAGWDLTSLSCKLADGTTATGTVASPGITGITVEAGKTTTCTFNNTALGHLKLIKNTVGGNGTFAFANNAAGLATSLTTSGGTANDTSDAIQSGNGYSISETVPAGWDLTSLSCKLADGTTATGTVASPGITGITVEAGKTTTCTFTNSKIPTLKIIKNVHGGSATFSYTVTGANSLSSPATNLTPPANGSAQFGPVLINTGSSTIVEDAPPSGWTLTDVVCTGYTGGGTGAGPLDSNGIPTSWNFVANYGDNVVCSYVNSEILTTRTQGFWATHTALANNVWNGTAGLPGETPLGADNTLCGVTITALDQPAENVLMGGFWSNVAKTSTGAKRSAIDQARMQMVQQYLAAVLNVHAFGSGSEQMLIDARTAYCGSDINAIKAQIGILGTFNSSGDNSVFTPGASATAQKSKSQADIDAWDNPLVPQD